MIDARLTTIVISFLTGLCLIAGSREQQKTIRYDSRDGLSSQRVGGGIQDRNGLLWIATWNGLNCYDGYDFHWVKIRPGDKASISTNHIRDILLSAEGNILCHTDDDIYEFDLDAYSFRDIPQDLKLALKDKVGRNWDGLTDTQGNRWFADRTGLYKTFSQTHPATLLAGTEGCHPRSFLIDDTGLLWVGMYTCQGLRIYRQDGTLHKEIDIDTAPYCLFQRGNGDIWIGGKPGALIKNGGESISSDAVYDIKEDRSGHLWIATFGGGVKCCPTPEANNPVLSSSFGGRKVRKLLITPSDNIIAATTEGLLIGHIDSVDYRKTSLRSIRRGRDPESLISDATMSVVMDCKGNIFIGTESSGIDMISERELFGDAPRFTHFNVRNSSLTNDICNAMTIVSDSLLMIVGSDNVMVFNPGSGETVNLGRAFWNDTCHFAETTPVMLQDGRWLFGAKQGAFVTTARDIQSMDFIPPLVFTTLAINGGAEEFCLPSRKKIMLKAGERNVSIHFAAIDYVDNEDILYRTRLDDSPWTGADRMRSVTLFNLSPGTHRLEVQSTDRYGRWADNVRSILITVDAYWYETWWAETMFALIAVILIVSIVYIYVYIRKVNRQRRDLLEKYMALIGEGRPLESAGAVGENDNDVQCRSVSWQKPGETLFLNRVRKYIEDNIDNPDANVDDMAAAAAASRSTLNRHLRSQLGVSAAQLLIEARMQRAEQLLSDYNDDECSISQVAEKCGYSDIHYFQRVFKKRRGMTPMDYRIDVRKS